VLSIGLFVFTEEPASAFSLGLLDYVMDGFVAGFSTGIFHCAGQSLIIHSISSFVTQYCISIHDLFGSFAAWIHMWSVDSLNLYIPSVSYTISTGMHHTLAVHCCIYSSNIANTMSFSYLFLLSLSFQRDSYLIA
jgi:hypothetical protein